MYLPAFQRLGGAPDYNGQNSRRHLTEVCTFIQGVQALFEQCQASMDPNSIAQLLAHHPYHIDALLAMLELYRCVLEWASHPTATRVRLPPQAAVSLMHEAQCLWRVMSGTVGPLIPKPASP